MAGEVCAVAQPGSAVQRVETVGQLARCDDSTTGVALIVNSAHEHRRSVERALDAGYHAVCEKPLTLSRQDSLRLLAHADERGRKLFCTNTYLFADYLRAFRRDWLRGRTFPELELTWADARAEVRHGEAKSYDSGVPVIYDVLPHVASIVLATHGRFDFDRAGIAVEAGGSAVTAQFAGPDLTLRARIARNAARRTRVLRFCGPAGAVTLDFTAEPGVVRVDRGPAVCADPAWPSRRRPIAQMLDSVKAYFAGGELDARLGADAALLANALIDGVAESYVQQQIDFLGAADRERAGVAGSAYAAKEADAIRQRALPELGEESPLHRLATFTRSTGTLA
jgi:predicted dehydrogenase